MALGRGEHDRAVEEAIVALAAAVGLDPVTDPAIAALARQLDERRFEDTRPDRERARLADERQRELEQRRSEIEARNAELARNEQLARRAGLFR
ncbi:MAG: hypothetical protein JWM85_2225 [Acidimicrobiaceae bacterium]|nr:hypothetical protein [Acidimicrobiaceae bacterium]